MNAGDRVVAGFIFAASQDSVSLLLGSTGFLLPREARDLPGEIFRDPEWPLDFQP